MRVHIGDRFGRLEVIEDLKRSELYTGRHWLCKCDCGIKKEFSSKYLLRGGIKSCGCYVNETSRIDKVKVGDKFGKLTVLEDLRIFKKNRGYKVICQCDCGNKKETYSFLLLKDKTKSCGCLRPKNRKKIKIGDRFERLVVIEEAEYDKGKKQWLCKCDCGQNKIIKAYALRTQQCRSCGCLKIDSHTTGFGKITGSFFCDVKIGARNRHLDFNLTIEFLDELFRKQNYSCALSGLPIDISPRKSKEETTASLDRIDSSKGYYHDNVQFVHKHINIMKSKYELDYFLKLCKIITEHNMNII